jgi:hypothetical protein
LAVKAPLVVVGGLFCLWWTTSRRERELRVEQAARAAMFGGFFGHAVVLLFCFGLMSLALGSDALSFTGGLLRDLVTKDPQTTSLSLFGWGLLALIESFLLGLAVQLLSPWLPR